MRSALLTALRQQRPFRRFKDTLDAWPDVWQAWFAFRDRAERDMIKEWLRTHGVDAEDASPRRLDPVPDEW